MQENGMKFGIRPGNALRSIRFRRVSQLYRILTFHFVHGSLGHLVVNMLGLAIEGAKLERALGTPFFIGVVVLALITETSLFLAIFEAFPMLRCSTTQ